MYDGWAATAVKRLKYQGEPSRAEHLALQMAPLLPEFGQVSGLIPVPLHASREKERGYNQSALLAEHIATLTGAPVLSVLRRTRKTVSQASLSGYDRKNNVDGVFEVDTAWVPKAGGRYVLIDDVRTTGATLNACAEALTLVRPSLIGVLTFALDMQREWLVALRQYQLEAATATRPTRSAVAALRREPNGPPRGQRREL